MLSDCIIKNNKLCITSKIILGICRIDVILILFYIFSTEMCPYIILLCNVYNYTYIGMVVFSV